MPLHVAVFGNKPQIFDMLIKAGALYVDNSGTVFTKRCQTLHIEDDFGICSMFI